MSGGELVEQNVIEHLLGYPDITAAVETRITPSPLPQGYDTWPAITVEQITDIGELVEGMAGAWREVRVQVNAFDPTRYGARRLDGLARVALEGFRGRMGSIKVGSIRRLNSFISYQADVQTNMVISDYRMTVVTSE